MESSRIYSIQVYPEFYQIENCVYYIGERVRAQLLGPWVKYFIGWMYSVASEHNTIVNIHIKDLADQQQS